MASHSSRPEMDYVESIRGRSPVSEPIGAGLTKSSDIMSELAILYDRVRYIHMQIFEMHSRYFGNDMEKQSPATDGYMGGGFSGFVMDNTRRACSQIEEAAKLLKMMKVDLGIDK